VSTLPLSVSTESKKNDELGQESEITRAEAMGDERDEREMRDERRESEGRERAMRDDSEMRKRDG
jgi:hypothetical protein